ncbi:hypothetical protein K461DRAFT_282128, partial [Myriangium duriaei CBS 260.36]
MALSPLSHELFLQIVIPFENDKHTLFQVLRVSQAWYHAGSDFLWKLPHIPAMLGI